MDGIIDLFMGLAVLPYNLIFVPNDTSGEAVASGLEVEALDPVQNEKVDGFSFSFSFGTIQAAVNDTSSMISLSDVSLLCLHKEEAVPSLA